MFQQLQSFRFLFTEEEDFSNKLTLQRKFNYKNVEICFLL